MASEKQVEDGWYRVCYGDLSTYSFVISGCIDHGSGLRVADLLNKGYTFEPVVMLTQAEYDALIQERDQLRETLAFAAQYKGIEARACPLCVYENGKFVEACQMHRDMEALRLQLIGLQTEYDRLNSLQSSTLLESQQKDWTIAELRQQLDTVAHNNSVLNAEIVALREQVADVAGWEDVPDGTHKNGIFFIVLETSPRGLRAFVTQCSDSLGVIKARHWLPANWRLQRKRRTESEGE